MTDPFLIEGPCLWSFSGGRTSAYMLWRALQAYGGTLPADHVVAFANTGKEREETLRFVYECGSRWGVEVVWLERAAGGGFDQVGFNSDSRAGEPFETLVREKGYTPNRGAGYCSIELKGRVIRDFCRSRGFRSGWPSVVGLRADEPKRLKGIDARNESGKDPWRVRVPLAAAGVAKREVMQFWLGPTGKFPSDDLPQGFDLGLWDYEGNCDLCWKKSDTKIMRIIRDNPELAEWWVGLERETGTGFSTPSIADLAFAVSIQPTIRGLLDQIIANEPEAEADAECGVSICGDDL